MTFAICMLKFRLICCSEQADTLSPKSSDSCLFGDTGYIRTYQQHPLTVDTTIRNLAALSILK